eukprot:CAMPEP_0194284444 /NCGR_PEP_ID=MMETSP0169-20130528/27648_1 /TAXON_ID=218684 /ORGANISM="Corethron pennatum, Strain L29A3" /LENGTH=310 /DNA_ID=CAMNT_0039030263 /DNA_START=281 /DNA_END=1213 /DNA_ORIENTATION=-
MSDCKNLSVDSGSQQQRAGQASHRLDRSVRREDRISELWGRSDASASEQKELDGLMAAGLLYEERYRPSDFTEYHRSWKAAHNEIFVGLVSRRCEYHPGGRGDGADVDWDGDSAARPPLSGVFYLDGPDAGTTSALLSAGFRPEECFVANRHASTCEALRKILPAENVVHACAVDALAGTGSVATFEATQDGSHDRNLGAFWNIPFGGFYFDICGGCVDLIMDMMSAALDNADLDPPIVVGFSILGGNRDVVDKEQDVIRKLVSIVKPLGMRVEHVFDDPEKYGLISPLPKKIDGGTMTTWCMIELSCRQ